MPTTEVFIATQVGQVIKINNNNGQYELVHVPTDSQQENSDLKDDNKHNKINIEDQDDEDDGSIDDKYVQDDNYQDDSQVLQGSAIKNGSHIEEQPFERAITKFDECTPEYVGEKKVEKVAPASGYKLIRYSNIRQNDFAGYEDEEAACFDMLDKQQVINGPPVSAATNKQCQITPQEVREEQYLEYNAEAENAGASSHKKDQRMQQFQPLQKIDEFNDSSDYKNGDERPQASYMNYKKCHQQSAYQTANPQPSKKRMIQKQQRSELFNSGMQTSGRPNQSSMLSNQSQTNKAKYTPTKDDSRVNYCHGLSAQTQTKTVYTQMILKQNKSKGNVLQKKNSVHVMNAPPPHNYAKHKDKLQEKRTDSCSNRNRTAKKFNSISPKMQDVIARGLNLRPQYVDPHKIDNKYIQVIPRDNSKVGHGEEIADDLAGQKSLQKNALAKPLRSFKGGLASQIQNVVKVQPNGGNALSSRTKQCATTMKDYQGRDGKLVDGKDVKIPKFKINFNLTSTAPKSQTSLLPKQKVEIQVSGRVPQQNKIFKLDNQKSQCDFRPKTQLQLMYGTGKQSALQMKKSSIDLCDNNQSLQKSILAAKGNQPMCSLMSDTMGKIGQRAAAMESSRLQRQQLRRQTSPSNEDILKLQHDRANHLNSQLSKDCKTINSDMSLRLKEQDLSNAEKEQTPITNESLNQQIKNEFKGDSSEFKKKRKTRNDRGIKVLDFKSSKNLYSSGLGVQQPSPRMMMKTQYQSRGHERQQSSQHEQQKYTKNRSPQKQRVESTYHQVLEAKKDLKYKQVVERVAINMGSDMNVRKSRAQMEETRSSQNQVPQLINCSESPIDMNTQSSLIKQDTTDLLNGKEIDGRKQSAKSPSMLKKVISPSSSKSKMLQVSQLNKHRDKKIIGANSSQAKLNMKKKSGKAAGTQPSPLLDPKKQRASIFDTKTPIQELNSNKVEYLQTKMNQVSLSPIRKFPGQPDEQQPERPKRLSHKLDCSITIISQKDERQNSSVEHHADAEIPSEKLAYRNVTLDNKGQSLTTAKKTHKQHGHTLHNEIEVSGEQQIQAQMDDSYLAPSEMTTSTQRVRLKRENQDLKEQIEMIKHMLQQKDLNLQEKNDQLQLMQKQLEILQLAQLNSSGNQAEFTDRSDLLYKSIDPNQGLAQLPKQKDEHKAMNQQQAIILERKQSVSTMRFCSFDQENNLNQIEQRMTNSKDEEQMQQYEKGEMAHNSSASSHSKTGHPNIEGKSYAQKPGYSNMKMNQSPEMQLTWASGQKENMYKESSPLDERNTTKQHEISVAIRRKEVSSPTSGNMSQSPHGKVTYTTPIHPPQHPHPSISGLLKPSQMNKEQELFSSSCSPKHRKDQVDVEQSSSQMSASFASKYFAQEDEGAHMESDLKQQCAPGNVNYTESVLLVSRTSSGQKENVSKAQKMPSYHSKPTSKRIEPALQEQMDQLKNKLAAHLKKNC